MQFQIRQSVQVVKKDHAREGQAGMVWEINDSDTTTVGVKFDIDGAVETVKVEDLQFLG